MIVKISKNASNIKRIFFGHTVAAGLHSPHLEVDNWVHVYDRYLSRCSLLIKILHTQVIFRPFLSILLQITYLSKCDSKS